MGGVEGWGRLEEEAAARPRGRVVSAAAARVTMTGRSFSASSPGAAMAGGAAARPWWVELARSYGGPKLPRLELRWRHQEWASNSSLWSPMTT